MSTITLHPADLESGDQTAILEACDLCRSRTEHTHLFDKNGYAIVRCNTCNLVSTQVPQNFDPSAIYDQSYFEGGVPDAYINYGNTEDVLRTEFGRIIKHIRRFKSGGRLLELGSAYGFFLKEARAYFDVQGVEISEAAVVQSQQWGLNVFQGDILSAHLPEDTFDVAVLLDCIEHLSNPYQALQELYRLLKTGGVLVITTGDFNSLAAGLMGRRWRLMTPPQHLFYFAPNTLGRMLAACGFTCEEITHPWKVVPLGLMAYQAGARLGFRLKWLEKMTRLGLPINLFDAMRVIAVKRPEGVHNG